MTHRSTRRRWVWSEVIFGVKLNAWLIFARKTHWLTVVEGTLVAQVGKTLKCTYVVYEESTNGVTHIKQTSVDWQLLEFQRLLIACVAYILLKLFWLTVVEWHWSFKPFRCYNFEIYLRSSALWGVLVYGNICLVIKDLNNKWKLLFLAMLIFMLDSPNSERYAVWPSIKHRRVTAEHGRIMTESDT